MPKKDKTLETCRAEIDAIDNSILELLAKRVQVVREVGEIKNADTKGKKSARKSIIRPGREAEMVRRIARQKNENLPHAAALAQMWRLIIASAVTIEEGNARVVTLSTDTNRECYWLAREYFGAFTPMHEKATVAEVVQDVVECRATVGVLPLWDRSGPRPWWSRIEGDDTHDMPRIFARLPFIQMARSSKAPLVAIGYVDPEETGEDESLWVIRAEEKVQFSLLDPLLEAAGLDYVHLETCRVLGVPNTHHYLIEINGFAGGEDPRLRKFLDKARRKFDALVLPISAHYLGSYAVPILFEREAAEET